MSNYIIAQKIDYKKFRTTLPNYVCGKETVKSIQDEYKILINLDSNKIGKKDLFLYFKDYGASCADMAMTVQNKSNIEMNLYLRKSSYYYEKAIRLDSTDTQLLWNYAFDLVLLNQCTDANKYLDLFTKYRIREKLVPKEEIIKNVEELKKVCGTE